MPRFFRRFKKFIFFGEDFLYDYRGNDAKAIERLNEAAGDLLKVSLTGFVAVIFSSLTYVAYPLYTYLFEDTRPMLIPIVLPFLEPEEGIGYYLNILNQFAISLTGVMGVIGIEFISSKIVNNVLTGVSMVEHAFDELETKKCDRESDINLKLRNIAVQVQDLDRYVAGFSRFFYWRFLLQPIAASTTIPAALFCLRVADWKSGYGNAFCTYLQLLVLCYMGETIKNQVLKKAQFHLYFSLKSI